MVYAIGVVLYLLIFLFRKKLNFIVYQLLDAFVYLITVSYIQTLDVTIVLYLFFAAIPFINKFKFDSMFKIISFLYFASFLIVSILLNGVSSAISIFIIRLIGILYFVYLFNNIGIKSLNINQLKILNIVFLLLETIIGIIGYYLSSDSSRLMLNYQCTVGCLSISGILILFLYVYMKNRIDLFSLITLLLYCAWPLLSGTRGYTVVTLGFLAIVLALYGNKYIEFFSFAILLLVLLLFISDNFWQLLSSITRFEESTGNRDAENKLLYLLFNQNSILRKLFGYGYGKRIGSIDNITWIINKVAYDNYTLVNFPLKNGFHNFYGTILYSSGLIGVTFVGTLFIYIIKNVRNRFVGRKEQFALVVYLVLYMFILWYRWTATSGILEFSSIAFCISTFKNINNQEGSAKSIEKS